MASFVLFGSSSKSSSTMLSSPKQREDNLGRFISLFIEMSMFTANNELHFAFTQRQPRLKRVSHTPHAQEWGIFSFSLYKVIYMSLHVHWCSACTCVGVGCRALDLESRVWAQAVPEREASDLSAERPAPGSPSGASLSQSSDPVWGGKYIFAYTFKIKPR